MAFFKTLAAAGIATAGLAGAAAAAPPVTAGMAPVGPPRPTGPLTPGQINGRMIKTTDVPVTCKLGPAGSANSYNVFFESASPVSGTLKWTAWKSCVGDAGCYLGRTNVTSGVLKNFSTPQVGGWPYLHDGLARDACEATVTTIG